MKAILSIIYVYYNTPTEINNSLASLIDAVDGISYEVIIIDNASPIAPHISHNTNIHIVTNQQNIGYGAALNQGVQKAVGTYVILVNPDTIFLKRSIRYLIDKMDSDNQIGIIGPQFLQQNNEIAITGNGNPFLPDVLFAFTFIHKLFPNNRFSVRYYLSQWDRKSEKDIPVICGACLLIHRKLFLTIEGFDEHFFLYFEESDLCFRIKKLGYRVLYYPKAKVIHLGGRSSTNKPWIKKHFEKSRLQFFKKYHGFVIAYVGEYFIRILNIF